MQIVYLADYVHFLPELAGLHFREWSYLRPGETLQGRTDRLRKCSGKGLPTVIIALQDSELCGSAMLVAHDLDAYQKLTPWLADVYVKPQHGNKGFASILIERIAHEAQSLGFPQLYLYTPSNAQLYEHLGWSPMEHCNQQGTSINVMSRRLT